MIGCYIIFSEKLNKFYVGATQDDVATRIMKHNAGLYGTNRFTSVADDWELFLFVAADDYAHAIRIERKIKSQKSSVYIRNLQKYETLQAQLASSTRLSR